MVSRPTILLPVFLMMNRVDLYNTYQGVILIHVAFQLGFCTFVLRNFMRTLPGEIFDAARIDGASEFGTYWRIALPLSLPGIAAIAVLEFTWIFNDYLWALILIQDDNLKPVTAACPACRDKSSPIGRWSSLARCWPPYPHRSFSFSCSATSSVGLRWDPVNRSQAFQQSAISGQLDC